MRRLKPLKRGGGRPLFLIHALTGGTGIYAGLAAALPDDLAIFGIDAVGREDWGDPDRSAESMARSAIEVLRRVQPEGPYRLCGYCLGGSVAYEMARLLRHEGDAEIDLLALIDSILWPTPPANAHLQKWLLFGAAVTGQSALSRTVPTSWFWQLDEEARIAAIWRDAVESGARILPSPIRSLDDLRRFFRYFDAMWSAGTSFMPRPHGIPFLYLETAESRRQRFGSLWSELTRGAAEIVAVPGTHVTVLVPPLVDRVAQHLVAGLERGRPGDETRNGSR